MTGETQQLNAMRDIAARADELCDGIMGKLAKGAVFGVPVVPDEILAKLPKGGLVAEGLTPDAAQLDKLYRFVGLLFFALARDLFKSIRKLEKAGSVLPCNILARSLFEALVNVLCIRTDPHKLAYRFLSYEYAQRYGFLLRWREAGRPEPENADEIEAGWHRVKHIHGRGKTKASPHLYWHGRKFWDICSDLGLEDEYNLYYKPDSDLSHASVQALRGYAQAPDDDEAWILCPSPRPSWRVIVLAKALAQLLGILEATDEVLSLGIGDALQRLSYSIKGLSAPEKPNGPGV